ncbi:hypothetical protein PF010_g19020 [Phytophthora fragariae]|uniref:Uncharacterized protein n=2 Tax=Phytophthora fragariae TaxID=53985 RepID=A0A6A4CRW1_9STRA|nr:hypothetical protein PF010_g19020 [Phytophthora fragariae]KAE9294127.1 hypothetical protein PF001_g17929 [Phytophthora fragariae]
MEIQHDIAVEGVTAFAPPPATSYRYVIELKRSKMSIWMEDRTSKKQWYKGGMAKTDYVSDANAIPDATVADYVKGFQDTLDSDLSDSTGIAEVQRKLHALDGGALRLEFAVKIRVLRSTWEAKYTFDLDSVSVERIDILGSKLRDQQEELEKLRGEIRDDSLPSFAHLQTSRKTSNSTVNWEAISSVDFVSTGIDGVVKAQRGGSYIILVTVTVGPGTSTPVYLLKNNTSIQVAYPGYSQGYFCSTSLSTIELLEKNDELTVTCSCNLAGTSYLCIGRVGN